MDAKTLREKRTKLIEDARAIRTRADEAKRDLTTEEIGQQGAMLADAKRLVDELRNLEELEREEAIPSLPESQRGKSKEEQDEAETRSAKLRSFLINAVEGRGGSAMTVEATTQQRSALMRERRSMSTRRSPG